MRTSPIPSSLPQGLVPVMIRVIIRATMEAPQAQTRVMTDDGRSQRRAGQDRRERQRRLQFPARKVMWDLSRGESRLACPREQCRLDRRLPALLSLEPRVLGKRFLTRWRRSEDFQKFSTEMNRILSSLATRCRIRRAISWSQDPSRRKGRWTRGSTRECLK